MIRFPDPGTASPDGLLAIGGDLSMQTLLAAYEKGIFPWYDQPGGPVLWWSPDPRMVLFPDEFHISDRLARRIRQNRYKVTENKSFKKVIQACAETRKDGTWIHPEMVDAYCRLSAAGYAHSIEVWESRRLVGGLYGVRLGRVLFAESMFSAVRDASKIALAHLVNWVRRERYRLIDCQLYSEHLASLGAREISRKAFLDILVGPGLLTGPGSD
jgi:leucyl/phenylalanyl-tRNA--protein transferase